MTIKALVRLHKQGSNKDIFLAKVIGYENITRRISQNYSKQTLHPDFLKCSFHLTICL